MKYAIIFLAACGTSSTVAPNPEAAACVAHRTTRQLECVDLFNTKPEIDACRVKVQAEINCTQDGGSDGNAD